ncbi:metallophosphoesterase family protein [Flavobacteriaceae bacterium M23B6Z8]
MTKILLLSDTHSHIDTSILKHASWADEVWHAGDIGDLTVTDTLKKNTKLRAVYGNIDNAECRLEFPEDLFFICEEVSVLMTHIGGYPGRYKPRVKALLEKHKPKLYICGHSHILKVIFDKKLDVLHMNPGAAGKHGFHQVRTMLRFVIDRKEIKNLEIIELETRK